jgi:hypothetical protein
MRAPKTSEHGTHHEPPKQSTVLLLLGTIADTTWRMFLPVLIGVAVGFWLDSVLKTQPWLAITGVILGSIGSGYFVLQQLKQVNK